MRAVSTTNEFSVTNTYLNLAQIANVQQVILTGSAGIVPDRFHKLSAG